MFETVKKFNKLLDSRQKKHVVILFFIILLGTVLEVMSVSMMVPMVSVLLNEELIDSNKTIVAIRNMLHITTYRGFIIFCIVSLIVLYILKDSFIIFQNYVQARFVCNNRLAMQRRLLNIILKRPYDFFLNIRTGEVTQMVLRDPANAYGLLATLLSMVTETIVSLALGITVLIYEPVMTIIVSSVIILTMIVITKIARPRIKEAGETFRKCSNQANSWVIQIVNGIKEIKITRREKFFERHYVEIADRGVKAEKKYKTINGIPRALIEMMAITAALAAILIMLLNGKNLTEMLPSLSAFALAAVKLLPCANKIAAALNDITYQQTYLDKLIETIDNLEFKYNEVKYEDAIGKPQISLEDRIGVNDLSFRYPGSERYILKDASFDIPVGKSVGIVGPSGAGKTTSIDIILGLLNPEKGTITADGVNIMDNYVGWLSHIGYIPQSIFMLDTSIRGNVAFGIPDDKVDDEKVRKAIKDAQLEEFVKSLPNGLDTSVGERGVCISGGQRQRIGIARALYYDPKLLVFDEATSSLDNDTESAIMESINSLHGKKTMIIIAHRLQTIEGCDMVYKVADGKIVRER